MSDHRVSGQLGKRPIGKIQRHVLWCMVTDQRPGVWTPWVGWHWETRSRTERIMESLRLRGMVTALDRYTTVNGQKIRYVQYKITEEGRKAAGRADTLPPMI